MIAPPFVGREVEPALIGRDDELDFLDRLTAAAHPSIIFVNGIGGIGKSRLLDAFAARRRSAGAVVVRIDCRLVEPTEAGFFRELRRGAGGEIASVDDAVDRLGKLGGVVLVLDDIDALGLIDTWLRRSLVPALPPNVHLVTSGRNPPLSAWLAMPWRGTFRTLELAPLADNDALLVLAAAGVEGAQAVRVNRIARGHPLALSLAAITLQNVDGDPQLEELAFQRVIEELACRHLAEIGDPVTRRAVEAAAIVRSVTAPMLGAMLPDTAPSDAYERLRSLPFMRMVRDGLQMHDSVRDAIGRHLRLSDPERHLRLRRASWSRSIRELRTAPAADLWRYTADLLYLLENVYVREAFFPSGAERYAIEPAQTSDSAAMLGIAAQHDGPDAAAVLSSWLTCAPEAFNVVRQRDGGVAGFYVLADASRLPITPNFVDPVLKRWLDHMSANPVTPDERVLFLRRWLSCSSGEAPGAIQAACWLDIKRSYMAYRPHLRRVYLTVRDLAPYAAAATQLGFTVLDDCATTIGNVPYFTAMLDFGSGSVDGWFAALVAAELGIATSSLLDIGAREMVVGTRRSALTRREFDTLFYLVQRTGKVVDREAILADVWGADADIASNVVDVVVRSLRKKLADQSDAIETISGVGYRLRCGNVQS